MNIYKPYEFAEMLGVTVKTLQRWDNEGKLKAFRNPSNRRYYTHNQYVEYMGKIVQDKDNRKTITFEYSQEEQKKKLITFADEIGCERVGDEIVKSIQDGNKTNTSTDTKD